MNEMHKRVALQSLFVLMHNVSEWTSFWGCLTLPVSLLIYLSPSLPLKILIIFSLPPCLAAPRPLPLPLPHFPLLFPFSLSLYTPLPPYFHPPILFTPPVILIKSQFGTVMDICTFDKTSEATCAIQGKLVLSCPCVIPVMFHCQFNTDNAMFHCRGHS